MSTLDEIGAIFYVQNETDLYNHTAFGISLPLEEAPNEFCEVLVLTDGQTTARMLHVVYVINNSYSVSLMMDESLPSEHVKNHWFEEFLGERPVKIYV